MKIASKISIGACLIFLAACANASPTEAVYVVDQNEIATLVMETMEALSDSEESQKASATAIPDRLPQSLYFLSDSSGSRQVWKMEKDGISSSQITFEDGDVLEFDVSPMNGSLAYISEDHLIVESDLIAGGKLILEMENGNDSEGIALAGNNFSSPRFSPEGDLLAFTQSDLKILDLSSGESQSLISNQYEELDSGALEASALYFPISWAPNGKSLLLAIATPEGGTLAFADIQTGEITEFQSSGIVCCQSIWSAQSDFVLVASPFLGLIDSGLWKYSLENGAEEILIASSGDDATLNFSGWPFIADDGALTFFYSSTAGIPDGDVPLFMVRGEIDNFENPERVRDDSFIIQDVLWALDGSLAIVLPSIQGKPGPLLIAQSDASPLEILIDNAWMPRWGPE